MRRRGPRGERPGDPGRQGAGRRRRLGLRTGQRRQRGRRQAARRERRHRPDDRVVCILTGHQLKDPTATVAYHTTDQEQFNKVLGSRGVSEPPLPIAPWPCPTSSTKSSRRSSCIASRNTVFWEFVDGTMATSVIGIHGAAGRMGQRWWRWPAPIRICRSSPRSNTPQHPKLGADAGVVAGVGPIGVPLPAAGTCRVDVVIDFSVPAATARDCAQCLAKKVPLVVATTGLDPTSSSRRFATRPQPIPIFGRPA